MTESRDVPAAVLEEEMAEQRLSVPAVPTKTAATRRTLQRAERAIEPSSLCSRQIGSRPILSSSLTYEKRRLLLIHPIGARSEEDH
jgi:hypothetical protein